MRQRRSWLRGLILPLVRRRGFAHDERGAVAVEFAILALPFFTLIYAILETALVFFASQVLDSAVQDASRNIRTGQAQNAATPWTIDTFRQKVCEGLYGLFDCDKLRVRVEVIGDFTSAAVVPAIDPDCEPDPDDAVDDDDECWTVAEGYQAGVGSNVVLVQVHYKWPTIINLPGFDLATLPGGRRLFSAARVFRNEPF